MKVYNSISLIVSCRLECVARSQSLMGLPGKHVIVQVSVGVMDTLGHVWTYGGDGTVQSLVAVA